MCPPPPRSTNDRLKPNATDPSPSLQGASPNLGELAAIRFTGSYNGVVFDDLFKTKEPLYFRIGGGTLLPVRFVLFFLICCVDAWFGVWVWGVRDVVAAAVCII